MKRALCIFALTAAPLAPQVNYGELRIKVTDPSGAAVRTSVRLTSTASGYNKLLSTDASGSVAAQQVPFGTYLLQVQQPGFAPVSQLLRLRSAIPLTETLRLKLPSVNTTVNVPAQNIAPDTLLDPESATAAMQIGAQQIQRRSTTLPGRSVQDLVNSQPGWLYEGNAVLHPRGSEYQTQFVVDGIPLTDNRSPSFGPEIEADDLDSMTIYTAGYPAEFGRKLGGVVELNTRLQPDAGLHGHIALFGGSYNTASAYAQLQETRGRNNMEGSASGSMTDHFLNPVVPQNFTNTGTLGDFSAHYERDLTSSDRLSLTLRHEFSRFLIPNELLQQQAGQRQNGDNVETISTIGYQHILSQESLLSFSGMVRENANDLSSNPASTPIDAFEHDYFREGYFKATASLHHGAHEFKAGLESDSIFLHENFAYKITDPTRVDEDTPPSLSFAAHRPDLEQSAFLKDSIHHGNWTIDAGLRWDHYQLLLNQNAFSPRLSVGRYLPSAKLLLHASYDRIFQTPSFENILISSSPQITAISNQFLRYPVHPSNGVYYEGGLTTALLSRLRLDANIYRRNMREFADDDQLLNTGVSYPIAFDRAAIYGAEGKLSLIDFVKFSGYVSYSYMVGNVWFPVTGGLFLGDDAQIAASQLTGHFPATQDQRHTLRTRTQYQLAPFVWLVAGASYNSGLPFEYGGTEGDARSIYGPQVVDRLNFTRGRVKPSLLLNASLGFDPHTSEKLRMHVQVDATNLADRLDVIDFGGLFSGNAIGPGRSVTIRLTASF